MTNFPGASKPSNVGERSDLHNAGAQEESFYGLRGRSTPGSRSSTRLRKRSLGFRFMSIVSEQTVFIFFGDSFRVQLTTELGKCI